METVQRSQIQPLQETTLKTLEETLSSQWEQDYQKISSMNTYAMECTRLQTLITEKNAATSTISNEESQKNLHRFQFSLIITGAVLCTAAIVASIVLMIIVAPTAVVPAAFIISMTMESLFWGFVAIPFIRRAINFYRQHFGKNSLKAQAENQRLRLKEDIKDLRKAIRKQQQELQKINFDPLQRIVNQIQLPSNDNVPIFRTSQSALELQKLKEQTLTFIQAVSQKIQENGSAYN